MWGLPKRSQSILGLEEKGRRSSLAHLDVSVDGDVESQLATAPGAPGRNGTGHLLVSEAPLHEGRRNRVFRSGRVDGLAGG